MTPADLSARHLAAIGLFALVPVAWYGIDRSLLAAGFATINVLLVLSMLYLAFSPIDGDGHNETRHDDETPT